MVTDREIREYMGHGKGSRKVVIHRGGDIEYYGSTDPMDRQHDYWHFGGYREDFARTIEADRARGEASDA